MRTLLVHEHLARACASLLVGACIAQPAAVAQSSGRGGHGGEAFLQDAEISGAAGRIDVPAQTMATRCLTMVSPHYPENIGDEHVSTVVTVRAVVRRSGAVSPLRVISGAPPLQLAAMNAVRSWRYRPYERDGEAIDVVTDIQVNFEPGKPGGLITHPAH